MEAAALGFKVEGIKDIERAKRELDKLTDSSNKAEKSSKSLTERTKELSRAASTGAGLIIKAAGAVAGLSAALVTVTAKSMDATAKIADQAGMAADEYSKLTFAVQQFANVSDQSLSSSVRRMTRRLDEAARGTGAAQKAIKGLGLEAKELARLRPEDQFKRISDEIAKIGSAGRQLSISREIFGIEGQALVNALREGGDALSDAAKEAEDFGVVLSEKAAKAASHYTGNIGKLVTAQRGFRQQITEQLLPVANQLTDQLVEVARGAGEAGRRVGSALASAADAAVRIGRALAPLGSLIMSVARYADVAVVALAGFFAPAALAGISALTVSLGVGLVGAIRAVTAAMLANPIGALVAALVTAGYLVYKFRDQIRDAIGVDVAKIAKTTANTIVNSFRVAYENVKFVFLYMGDAIMGGLIGALNVVIAVTNQMVAGVIKGINFVIEAANSLPFAAGNTSTIDSSKFNIEKFRNDYADNLTLALSQHNKKITQMMSDDLFGPIGEAFSDLSEHGGDTFKGLGDGIDDFGSNASDASKKVSKLKELLDDLFPGKKLFADYLANMKLLDDAHSKGTLTTEKYTQAVKELEKRYKEESEKYLPEATKKTKEKTKTLNDHIKTLQDQVKYFDLSEAAILRIDKAEAQAALSTLEAAKATAIASDASKERIAVIEGEIQALKELIKAQGGALDVQTRLDDLKLQKSAWQSWADDVKTVFDQLGQSLTDALFEGGKSGGQMIKDFFKTLVLRVAVQPVMGALTGMFSFAGGAGGIGGLAGSTGGTVSTAMGLGNLATGLKSAWSAITGGFAEMSTTIAKYTQSAMNLISGSGGIVGQGPMQISGFAQGVGTVGSYLGGIGAGMGLGSLISGQYSVGGSQYLATGIGTAAGAAIGAKIGMIGGPLGAAIGGAIGGAVNRLFGRGQKEDTNQYIWMNFDAQGVSADVEKRWRQKGGALRSGREGSNWDTLDGGDEFLSTINELYVNATRELQDYANILLGDAAQTLEGFEFSPAMVQLNHPDPEIMQREIESFIQDALSEATAYMVGSAVSDFWREGEGYHDTLARLVTALTSMNDVLDVLGLRLFDVSAQGGHFASTLIDMMGGMDNVIQATDFYYQNFYSEAERIAKTTEQLTNVFGSLGYSLPASRDEFRALVDSLDLTTDAGQVLFATMMTVAPAFDQISQYAERAADSIENLGGGLDRIDMLASRLARTLRSIQTGGALADRIGREIGIGGVFSQRREFDLWAAIGNAGPEKQIEMAGELTDLVLNRIQLEQDAQRKQADSLREQLSSVTRMRDLARSLQDYLRSLESSDLAPYSLAEKIGYAERDLAELVRKAQSGDEQAMGQVQGALQNALQLWRDYAASSPDYQKAYDRLTGLAGNLASGSFSAAERQVRSLERQIEQLDGISGYSADQVAQLQELYDIAASATEALEAQYAQDRDAMLAEVSELEMIGMDTARLHDIADLIQGLPAQIGAIVSGGLSREINYLLNNADVLQAYQDYGTGNLQDFARQHYEQYGQYEGRDFSAGSTLSRGEKYMMNNPDVLASYNQNAMGKTIDEYARLHYDTHGQAEGRSYRIGTARVPYDMNANVHEGEMIIDPHTSSYLRQYGIQVRGSGGGEMSDELRAVKEEVVHLREITEILLRQLAEVSIDAAQRSAQQITEGVGNALARRRRSDVVDRQAFRPGALA